MSGVLLYDISKPSKTVPIGNYDTPGDSYDIFLVSNEINIADGINGVLKVKWNPPDTFTLLKQYHDGLIAYKVYNSPSGNIYAVFGKDGIKILK